MSVDDNEKVYSDDQRREFMSVVLSVICTLAFHVDLICSEVMNFDGSYSSEHRITF